LPKDASARRMIDGALDLAAREAFIMLDASELTTSEILSFSHSAASRASADMAGHETPAPVGAQCLK